MRRAGSPAVDAEAITGRRGARAVAPARPRWQAIVGVPEGSAQREVVCAELWPLAPREDNASGGESHCEHDRWDHHLDIYTPVLSFVQFGFKLFLVYSNIK